MKCTKLAHIWTFHYNSKRKITVHLIYENFCFIHFYGGFKFTSLAFNEGISLTYPCKVQLYSLHLPWTAITFSPYSDTRVFLNDIADKAISYVNKSVPGLHCSIQMVLKWGNFVSHSSRCTIFVSVINISTLRKKILWKNVFFFCRLFYQFHHYCRNYLWDNFCLYIELIITNWHNLNIYFNLRDRIYYVLMYLMRRLQVSILAIPIFPWVHLCLKLLKFLLKLE